MHRLFRGCMTAGIALLLVMTATWITSFSPTAHAASTLIVTTTADLSTCTTKLSLRCAITQANKDGSGDTITFNIPRTGPGCVRSVCTISITDAFNPLPTLTASNTTINGYTQPGARPNTNPLSSGDNAILTVHLDGGPSLNVEGVGVSGNGDIIKGFSITNFVHGIETTGNSTGLSVQGNFIGIEPDGSTPGINENGFLNNAAGTVTIGGTSPASSNVISGNSAQVLTGNGDTLQGNIIGLNAAGNAAISNLLAGDIPGDGIDIGSNDLITGNVISGNASGIRLFGSNSKVQGNLIGTDVTGKVAIGNEEGLTFQGNSGPVGSNVIGGTVPAARNIISGNFNFGIDMTGQGNVVEGNYIGADITGEVALPNGGQNGSTPDINAGILLSGGFTANSTNNIIGGTTSAARNVISGNAFSGVRIAGQTDSESTGNTLNNLVEDNFIGLDATGTRALGNGTNGVFIGSEQGFGGPILNNGVSGNVIAHNGQSGILIGSSANDTGVHSPISRNSTFANGGLGIDLAPQGTVNCNTPPPGPNDYAACPVIKQATTTLVSGTAPANATVEVFIASNEANAQGHGEGQTFLGSATANAAGSWSLTLTGGQVTQGQLVTATSTTSGTTTETSEFAANVTVR